jgi:predicted TIM-barrel fold metal-dependent hydrolase
MGIRFQRRCARIAPKHNHQGAGNMLIVDAQVHIWGANTPERPWPARLEAHRDVPIGKDELLREMDAAGVDGVIIVPPSWEGDRNDLALAAARAHPDRFAVMGRLDTEAAGAREGVETWRNQTGMLGLRFTFHAPMLLPPLTEGRMDWVWKEAERHGIPIMMLVPHSLTHLVDHIAERHPGLKLVMDHLALTRNTKDLDKLLALAKRANVAVKASALPCFTNDVYPYRHLHPYLRRVYDAFGPRRMFWGTDFSRLPCTYREGITMFTEEMPWLSAEDKTWIMGRGICEWLGWRLP